MRMTKRIKPRQVVRLLAYDGDQAAEAIGVSRRLLDSNRDAWRVPYRKLGTRIIYPIRALEEWLNGAAATLAGEES